MSGADHGQPRIVKYGMKLRTQKLNRNDLVVQNCIIASLRDKKRKNGGRGTVTYSRSGRSIDVTCLVMT